MLQIRNYIRRACCCLTHVVQATMSRVSKVTILMLKRTLQIRGQVVQRTLLVIM